MARVEFQNDNSRLLNTQENRKAFVAKYKDRLYGLALNLTQDSRQSCNLVVAAFQHAFEKYTTRPCPEDCFPFLSSSIYLLFASGNETEGLCSSSATPDSTASYASAARPVQATERPAQADRYAPPAADASRPAQEYRTYPRETMPTGEQPVRQPVAAPTASQRFQAGSAGAPRHAQPQQTDFSQPLSRQVFDPDHTEYWTPGMEQGPTQPVVPEASPPASGSSDTADGQTEWSLASAVEQEQEEEARQQPSISQAYMYDAEVARKRKSVPLVILNTFFTLLFLWMLIGLLIRMEMLPEWNLGYAWFNLYIYPLF